MSTSVRDTTKFESLHLERTWIEAAGHVDHQLSNPGACSYKSELGEAWRGLDAVAQRSYVVVAVKKCEGSMRGRRMLSFAERYMMLTRFVFELLWVSSSNRTAKRRPAPERKVADARPAPIPVVSEMPELEEELSADTTATIIPRSPAWYCLRKREETSSRRFEAAFASSSAGCRVAAAATGRPTSPLARFAPVSVDSDELLRGFGEDSDTSSVEW